MAKELLKRSEVNEEFTWDLTALYPDNTAWEAAMAEIQEMASDLAKMEGHIADSPQTLLSYLTLWEEMEKKTEPAASYAHRLNDQDTGNTVNQAMVQKMQSIYAGMYSRLAFADPEILAIDEETLERFYAEEPRLEAYRKYIQEIQRLKPHCLSSEMERLLAMTKEMSSVPNQTFSVFNNADLKLPEMTDENGETVRITHGRYGTLIESADRRVRREAFEKMYQTYKQFENTLASLYSGQIKKLMFYAKARKYDSTLEAAVDRNDVSPSVYENLLATVNANLDKMYRYVSLRKRLLGVDELHMYDVYTPIIPDASRKISFEEAKETVLKALAPLGEDYLELLREGFDHRWIDVYENEGKRSGAYSAGTYGVHPYVLMNYTDTLDDMFTLAHEMGHALHSHYSSTVQPYLYSNYKIFVAEVASTCNEILLMEYLLKNTADTKERAYLLNHYLDSFKGTVYRQTMFAEFEKKTNAMAEAGESLTAQVLNDVYYELNQRYFGPDMVSDAYIAGEWARIPHFYYNFYVYQYATGFSAAVAIARNILKEGAPAVARYKEFLSGGCSKSPVELLKIAGVNLESPHPIQEALDVFGEVLDEIEKLV
ncbi:MAG: oligoendopeptidase F [Lachnospiraceae bacterium]|jgi:oligoendopeptidase F|nr:oligoendopeptidase F [Lachnospiraceae bacterium]